MPAEPPPQETVETAPSVDQDVTAKESDGGFPRVDFSSTGTEHLEAAGENDTSESETEPEDGRVGAQEEGGLPEDDRPAAEAPAESKPPEAEKEETSLPDEQPQYGRSRTRKGPGMKTEEPSEKPAADNENDSESSEETPEFSNENISFGRIKRKRVR